MKWILDGSHEDPQQNLLFSIIISMVPFSGDQRASKTVLMKKHL